MVSGDLSEYSPIGGLNVVVHLLCLRVKTTYVIYAIWPSPGYSDAL